MTRTICKRSIMKSAWAKFKAQSDVLPRTFAAWLKTAWVEAKHAAKMLLISIEDHLHIIKNLNQELYFAEMSLESYPALCRKRVEIAVSLAPHRAALEALGYATL